MNYILKLLNKFKLTYITEIMPGFFIKWDNYFESDDNFQTLFCQPETILIFVHYSKFTFLLHFLVYVKCYFVT